MSKKIFFYVVLVLGSIMGYRIYSGLEAKKNTEQSTNAPNSLTQKVEVKQEPKIIEKQPIFPELTPTQKFQQNINEALTAYNNLVDGRAYSGYNDSFTIMNEEGDVRWNIWRKTLSFNVHDVKFSFNEAVEDNSFEQLACPHIQISCIDRNHDDYQYHGDNCIKISYHFERDEDDYNRYPDASYWAFPQVYSKKHYDKVMKEIQAYKASFNKTKSSKKNKKSR